MATTWLPHGYHMATTWLLHGYHMMLMSIPGLPKDSPRSPIEKVTRTSRNGSRTCAKSRGRSPLLWWETKWTTHSEWSRHLPAGGVLVSLRTLLLLKSCTVDCCEAGTRRLHDDAKVEGVKCCETASSYGKCAWGTDDLNRVMHTMCICA